MNHYVIGDVQGCYKVLRHLLETIGFNYGKDTLWFAGDIVNRGPESLQTIRFIKQHDTCMQTVLGNHDLYLLFLSTQQNVTYKKLDTVAPIIDAPDQQALIDWLRCQPMYLQNNKFVVVHAGIFPDWTLEDTRRNGDEISSWLQGTRYQEFLTHMLVELPNQYSGHLSELARLKFNINVFTRMRALYRLDKTLDFTFKSSLDKIPAYLSAWFNFDNDHFTTKKILFGHWSGLGLYHNHYATCLDTGAVWGGHLSAYNLNTGEIISVPNDML